MSNMQMAYQKGLEEGRKTTDELIAALHPLIQLYAGQITNTGEYYPQLFDAARIAITKAMP
jgi:hypothetical protein